MSSTVIRNTRGILNSIQKLQGRQIKTTVDDVDVYKHSQLMHSWWDLQGLMQPLHQLNSLRVPFIRDGLVTFSHPNDSIPLKGKKILDVGCGGGILSEGLAKLGAEVTGIDAGKDLIELAQSHAMENEDLANNRPSYIYTTIEEHSDVNPEKYDAVVASEVIEHVNEKELFLKSCVRATKTNGKLFFTTPSKTRIAQLWLLFISEYILHTIPKGTHQYEKFMTPNDLKIMIEKNNCLVESIRGFLLDPFSGKWKWSNHKLIMFAIEATKKETMGKYK